MPQNRWTKEQTIVAFALYCQMPFGKIHKGNKQIIDTAKKIGRTPSALAMKMLNLASLDPKIRESGRSGLGNASDLDRSVWNEYHNDWKSSIERANQFIFIESDFEKSLDYETLSTTTISSVILRKNQSFFRKAVLASYKSCCCISRLSYEGLLIASHIVPWSLDGKNRLNPQNGLCLSVFYDKAFDLGIITIDADFRVVVSNSFMNDVIDEFSKANIHAIHGKEIELPEKFIPSLEFLNYHNNYIFKG